MFRWPKLALFLGFLAVAGVGVSAPAAAQSGCLSTDQARSLLQSGQVAPISQLRAQIAPYGEIVGIPQLCQSGGRYVYIVNVLNRSGQVQRLTVNAGSGAT